MIPDYYGCCMTCRAEWALVDEPDAIICPCAGRIRPENLYPEHTRPTDEAVALRDKTDLAEFRKKHPPKPDDSEWIKVLRED